MTDAPIESSRWDYNASMMKFQRELNRRDGSYLIRSSAPFSRSPKALLEDVRVLCGMIAERVSARMNRPYPKWRAW